MLKFLKKHYHWIIAAILFLVTCIRGGIANNLSALHTEPVSTAMKIPRAQFSLAISASSLAGMLSTMVSGAAVHRISSRVLMTGALLVCGTAYFLMAKAESYGLFLVGNMMIGSMMGFCGDANNVRIVSAWFHKRRGMMLGLISSATAFGGSVICLWQTAVIEKSNYRSSFMLAAALFVFASVLAVVFVRTHPAKMGRHPYGDGEKIAYKKREHEDHWHGFDMKRLVRRPTFYMMVACTLFSNLLAYLAYYVIVPHFRQMGLTPMQASSMQSVLMMALAGTKILVGILCDKIGARKVTLLCVSIDAVALVLLTLASNYGIALLSIVCFSMALPIMSITIPMLASSLFGYRAQAQYNGIFLAMVPAAAIMAGPISNAVYDKIGTYSPVFLVAAGMTVPLVCIYLLMYRLADKDRAKLEAEEVQMRTEETKC